MHTKKKNLGFTNAELAAHAKLALKGRDFVTRRGNCLRFVREIVTDLKLGAWPLYIGPDAWQAFKLLAGKGYSVPLERGSKVGDIIFKAPTPSNPHGHVGVRIGGNLVVENSTRHARTDFEDARGICTLKQFGPIAGIVRLGND